MKYISAFASIFVLIIALFNISACYWDQDISFDIHSIESYRDIPGITEEEISAIETLLSNNRSFSFVSMFTTESFVMPDGTYSGFIPGFCKLLSDLFGIPFIHEVREWIDLKDGIDNGTFDFTGEFTPSPERRSEYFMTNPIAQRSLVAVTYGDSVFLQTSQDLNGLVLGFLEGTINSASIKHAYPNLLFEEHYVEGFEEAIESLETGIIDTFITDAVDIVIFSDYPSIRFSYVTPLVYTPVSLATARTELEPIISAVTKYIIAGGINRLMELYSEGSLQYTQFLLYQSFSDEEKAYINNLSGKVPIVLASDIFPISFFSEADNEFQGISVDVLDEVSRLTGIEFEAINDQYINWPGLLDMLRKGEAALVSMLVRTEERATHFIWHDTPYFSSQYAFISRLDFPNLEFYQIEQTITGAVRGTANVEIFQVLFPDGTNLRLFDTQDQAFDALERGEINLFLALDFMLLYQTHYREKPGFKINYPFMIFTDSYFGFNRNEYILSSIVDKALYYIDRERIARNWTGRVFDYSRKMAENRAFYLALIAVLLSLTIIVISAFFVKYFQKRKKIIEQTSILSAIYYSIPAGIFCKDLDGLFLNCNQQFAEFISTDQFAIIGKTSDDISVFSKIMAQGFMEADNKVLKDKISLKSEDCFTYPDNSRKYLETIKTPLMHGNEIIGLMGFVIDVTERKLAEEAEQRMVAEIQQQSKLLTLVNRISAILIEPDIDKFEENLLFSMSILAKSINANRVSIWKNKTEENELYCMRLYQWTEGGTDGEINGAKPAGDMDAEADISYSQALPGWENELSTGNCINMLVREMPPVQREQFLAQGVVSILAVPMFLYKQFFGFIEFEDHRNEKVFSKDEEMILRSAGRLITNALLQREMTQNMQDAFVAANAANRAKTDFLAKMSHEIRTPMNAIMGMAELALRTDELNSAREHILTVKQAGTNLLAIINDILDFSKIEMGKMEIVPEEYSFSSMINDVISIIRMKILDSEMRFATFIDSNLPNTLIGDETRIRQVLLNILNNAVKYSEKGFVSLTVMGEKVNANTINLIIEVMDSGKGIEEKNLDKLFGEYVQVDQEKNKGIEGVGLGLAITWNIVKAMEGEIKVFSEYGKGSTFTVTLPQVFETEEKLASVFNPEEKSIIVYEQRDIYAHSIISAISDLGLDCTLVSTDINFKKQMESNVYTFIFISAALYEKNKNTIAQFGQNAKIVLFVEFGEAVSGKNLSIVAMPVHCISIANILNGISNQLIYNVNKEITVRFSAPDAKILVVDDIATNLKVVDGLLLPYNMKVDLCKNGKEAINKVKNNQYDLVFMDHKMPEMDGIEATAIIRDWELERPNEKEMYGVSEGNSQTIGIRRIPIVALTANAVSGTKEMFIENGFDDFLPKPIDTVQMNIILETWIPKEKQKYLSEEPINIVNNDLDMEKGIKYAGGTKEAYHLTLSAFYEDGIEKIEEINTSLETGNIPLYTTSVHGLKSAAASIGAFELSEKAKKLEIAGQNEDMEYIKTHNNQFIKDLELLLEKIIILLQDKHRSMA